MATSSERSPARARPAKVTSVPATRSLRTLRLVTGGDPGRVSPIFGLGGGGAGRTSATTGAASAGSSRSSSSGGPTTDMPVCRPRPPREPRRRRRETFVTALSGVSAPSGPEPSTAPLPSGRPEAEASCERSRPMGDQSRCWSSIAGFSSPSRPDAAGSELALPASPSTGSDIETFPSKQARSGARHAHVATGTPGDVPGRAAGSQPRAVAPYR